MYWTLQNLKNNKNMQQTLHCSTLFSAATVLTILLRSNRCQSNEKTAQNQNTASLGQTVLAINICSCCICHTLLLLVSSQTNTCRQKESQHLLNTNSYPTWAADLCNDVLIVCIYICATASDNNEVFSNALCVSKGVAQVEIHLRVASHRTALVRVHTEDRTWTWQLSCYKEIAANERRDQLKTNIHPTWADLYNRCIDHLHLHLQSHKLSFIVGTPRCRSM
jgi:hypothetical protein